jgi:protein TonB
MKHFIHIFFTTLLIAHISVASAQNGELNLNGMASFEQLKKEYYVGALYLGWPGHDAPTIANMPGKKRMELHITADRWPALRFSQFWNQLITINNPSAEINNNAMDIVAFTSIPKGDLVEGDHLVIELTGNNTTLVSLNGVTALRTDSAKLFSMLLNTWIGQRPPTSEFKRDMLDLPKNGAGTELVARFNSIKPNDTRKKTIAGWGLKAEPETTTPTAATATTVAVAAAAHPTPTPAPAPVAATPVKKDPAASPKQEPVNREKELAAAQPVAAAPQPAAVTPQPVAAAPQQVATAPQPLAVIPQPTDAAKENQKALYGAYVGQLRKLVIKAIEYPKRAVIEKIEGLVVIKASVDRNGSLIALDILQSADDLLDAAAMRAVQKSAPFPKPDSTIEGNIFEAQIPIVFKLAQ